MYVIIFSLTPGGSHWIWNIIDILKRSDLKTFQMRSSLIAVIAAPGIGGRLFYMMHQRSSRIAN